MKHPPLARIEAYKDRFNPVLRCPHCEHIYFYKSTVTRYWSPADTGYNQIYQEEGAPAPPLHFGRCDHCGMVAILEETSAIRVRALYWYEVYARFQWWSWRRSFWVFFEEYHGMKKARQDLEPLRLLDGGKQDG